MISRRGFLAALPALVAGIAVAKALPPEPEPLSWKNLQTAAPLTKAQVEETIQWLETSRATYSVPMRYAVNFRSPHGLVWNSGR